MKGLLLLLLFQLESGFYCGVASQRRRIGSAKSASAEPSVKVQGLVLCVFHVPVPSAILDPFQKT